MQSNDVDVADGLPALELARMMEWIAGDAPEGVQFGHRFHVKEAGYDDFRVTGTLLRDAAKAIRALTTAREEGRRAGMGWQPIETAPKDGTWVLVVVAGYTPITALWINGKWHVADSGNVIVPTHWQPLPRPPAIRDRITSEGGE